MASAHRDGRTGWQVEESRIGRWGWRRDLGRWHGFEDVSAWESYQRVEPWPLTVYGWELDDEEWGIIKREVQRMFDTPKTARRAYER